MNKRHKFGAYLAVLLLTGLLMACEDISKPTMQTAISPLIVTPNAVPTPLFTLVVNPESSHTLVIEEKWPCIQQANVSSKSTWETCWMYVVLDASGRSNETSKESATAIEWKGPTDLNYTTIGQYNETYYSEWFTWARQGRQVRFCVDRDTFAEVGEGVEKVNAGCHTWTRGPFMVRKP